MGIFLYALAWLAFGLSHSLLARQNVQRSVESVVGRSYRLLYNLFAAFQIALVYLFGRTILSIDTFTWLDNDVASGVSVLVRLMGMLTLLAAIASYDIGRFAGVTQLFTGERLSASCNEPLQRKGLNRWVRHPLYTGAFLLLWGGAFSMFDLLTAIWGSLYLVIGTAFEERKLVNVYADEYRQYQNDVPKYFPAFKLQKSV